MDDAARPCPVPGCEELTVGKMAMCNRHWFTLPAYMRQSITLESGDAWHKEVAEAVKWLEDQAARSARAREVTRAWMGRPRPGQQSLFDSSGVEAPIKARVPESRSKRYRRAP